MAEIGDYVLIHNIKNIEGTTMAGEPLPVWGRVKFVDKDGDFDYGVELCHSGSEGTWGIDEDDLVPIELITDTDWARLAEWRLTSNADV